MPALQLFEQLKSATGVHQFSAAEIPGHAGSFLAADRMGRPSLVVSTQERAARPVLRTANLVLAPGQTFRLTLADGSHSDGSFDRLSCESTGSGDHEAFLLLVDMFTEQAPAPAPRDALVVFFRSLVRLFATEHARDVAAAREGLWGELFLMRAVRGFRFWMPSWHSEATRKFDFSAGSLRVEAKSVIGPLRVHHFGHRQLYAQPGEEILIASLLLREEDAGLSLRELIEECREAVRGTSDALKLESAVRSAGMEDPAEVGPRFDASEAQQSLAWYRAEDAPHFRMAEPPGVTETRYRVDLSVAPRLEQEELDRWLARWAPVPVAS